MNRRSVLCLAILAGLLFTALVAAAVPRLVSYQGRLLDGDGNPIADGNYNITFQIVEHDPLPMGESPLWSSGVQSVSVTDGLFVYYLGSNVPLPQSIFTNDALESHFVRVFIEGSMLASAGVQLAAVPFAFESINSDTAAYARSGPGSGAVGWVDDGAVVRLQSGGDRVGIGTSSPSENLVVGGGDLGSYPGAYIVAANSEWDDYSGFKLGWDANNHATLQWYGDGDQLKFNVRSFGTSYNNNLVLRSGYVGIGVDYPEEPLAVGINLGSYYGDFVQIGRLGSGRYSGFMCGEDENNRGTMLWYNNSNELRLGYKTGGVDYGTALVLKDGELHVTGTGNSSVQLPDNAISSQEILDEPGLNTAYNDSPVTVYHGQPVASVTTYFPGPGYALVIGTANWYPLATEHTVDAYLSISDRTDVLGVPAFRYNFSAGSHIHNLSSTIHAVKEIEAAGSKTFYLMASYWEVATNSTTTETGQISVLYVPTWYSTLMASSSDGSEQTVQDDDLLTLPQSNLDQIVAERVRVETYTIREEFDQQLVAMREEFQRQMDELKR